jgi:antitoxin component of MazEF toxin-antitoxin module
MVALKLVTIGNSVGVVIPKDLLGKLGRHLHAGDGGR